MAVRIYEPQFPLSRYIQCLWMVDDRVPYKREKILPTTSVELIINFGSPHRLIDTADDSRFTLMQDSWIVGLQSGYLVNEPLAETLMMGVRFKPGGAYPFFDLPISELSNFVIHGDLILGRHILDLRSQLLETPGAAAKFRLLEGILRKRLRDDLYNLDAMQYAAAHIAETGGVLSIRDLSEHMGMSQKHLSHLFKKMVGVTPKHMARIARLQRVLHTIDPRNTINWAEIAYQCQYYDQAHFNRDFQNFTGLTPTAYVELRAQVFGELSPGEDVHFVPIG